MDETRRTTTRPCSCRREDEDEDLSLLPDLSPPPTTPPASRPKTLEAAGREADAGSEAVDPLRLSVR